MARDEQPREDLIREARALRQRAELTVPAAICATCVVLGVRENGALSVYFGEDPAWHFNPQGELRRGFRDGKLLKAEDGQLVELTRHRGAEQIELRRRVLPAVERDQLLMQVATQLTALATAIEAETATALRTGGDLAIERYDIGRWLKAVALPVQVAASAGVGA